MNQCILCKKKLNPYKKINGVKIYECPICSIAITNNPPSAADLYEKNFPYDIDQYRLLQKLQEQKFSNIIRIIKKYIPRGRILEVGAGYGLFAHMFFSEKTYEVEIVEPHLKPYFIESNPQIIKHRTTYERFVETNKKKYDCVLFLDVLEHFNDPQEILAKTRSLLTDNGYIVLQLPNYKSLMARICTNWSWWMVEDHKFHFSPKSIRLILDKNGYKTLHLKTYEAYADFRKNLDGNFSHIKKDILRKLAKLVILPLIVIPYLICRNILWKKGLGGLIFIVAQKIP